MYYIYTEVTPSLQFKDFWVLELFHGPTFAFKDVALQFLGNLFEYFLSKKGSQGCITILGATSGDTGSAAIYGLRGKQNVNCFIMYPRGKVSEIQEKQMTTILDDNVDCISIEGDFDDAQAIVKAAFADQAFREEVKLGAINSINWARVLAQITYYFYSWLKVTEKAGSGAKLNYAVPTGNFGDILAGYYAKRMGLPIDKLVVCTNENDVLHRFLTSGSYSKNPAVLTISPSMDISVSSNFERYLFYLANEDPQVLNGWMSQFEKTGEVTVSADLLAKARAEFLSYSSHKTEIVDVMRSLYLNEKYLVCPHTATAVAGILSLRLPAATTVCLATAHPAKFADAVGLALDGHATRPEIPSQLRELFKKPVKKTMLPNAQKAIQSFILKKVGTSTGGEGTGLWWLAGLTATAAVAVATVILMQQRKR